VTFHRPPAGRTPDGPASARWSGAPARYGAPTRTDRHPQRRHQEHHRLALATAGDRQKRAGPEVDEIWEALARLRPERRIVLVLRFYEDLSHDRIAELVACSASTVRSRTRRALGDLRKEMNR
jgi:RNA polymerase sigma factor (sigma-70 family)